MHEARVPAWRVWGASVLFLALLAALGYPALGGRGPWTGGWGTTGAAPTPRPTAGAALTQSQKALIRTLATAPMPPLVTACVDQIAAVATALDTGAVPDGTAMQSACQAATQPWTYTAPAPIAQVPVVAHFMAGFRRLMEDGAALDVVALQVDAPVEGRLAHALLNAGE